ncbi:MAG: ribulokinase [Ruminococcaceae bacterium]|nr:ribulokinase [Oscillospiraceae bacterium]
MKNYTVGIDYGTLSGRVSIVDCENGNEIMSKELVYPHGVMEKALPDGTPLGDDWALQHPEDYLMVITETLPALIKESGISPSLIKGVGVDFTACTILPVLKDATPLCMLPQYASQPNAYAKLWKHHAAQKEADFINEVAKARGEKWFESYGSKISCEFAYPKILQTLREAPEIYEKADYFIDAGDWIIWKLCGQQKRSACIAGFKYFYTSEGYPSAEFNTALDKRFENLVSQKLNAPVIFAGQKAGEITEEMSRVTGLEKGTAVCCAMIDAHAAAPALKITRPGRLFAILGTSGVFIIMDQKELSVKGILGNVDGGTMAGYIAYEAGQSCYGDSFAWVVKNMFPEDYAAEAREKGLSPHQLLTEKASKLAPGESGLMVLDWFNGNRSILNDSELSGMILGINLNTTPEEVYRAFMEATSFSTKIIIDNFVKHGIAVDSVYATGGIASKNPVLVQMLSDVLELPVYLSETTQGGAVGSAIYAAQAAGVFDTLDDAAQAMGRIREDYYKPNPEMSPKYRALYKEYLELHDYFGSGGSDVMHRLRKLKK